MPCGTDSRPIITNTGTASGLTRSSLTWRNTCAARVSKSASVEVLVAVLVLFVTAVLVALPTPLAVRGP